MKIKEVETVEEKIMRLNTLRSKQLDADLLPELNVMNEIDNDPVQ